MAGLTLHTWIISAFLVVYAAGDCTVPDHFRGQFYSIEVGVELFTVINENNLQNGQFDGECVDKIDINRTDIRARNTSDAYILFNAPESDCYKCFLLEWRTPNVIQYKYSECYIAEPGEDPSAEDVCANVRQGQEFYTFFRTSYVVVNCINTFEGSYNFTYEIDEGGGGICSSPMNFLEACQEPGSMYADNYIFKMNFGQCEGIGTSRSRKYEFQCMGSWEDDQGNVWAAVSDRGEDIWREKFRCLLTRYDQELPFNRMRWTMSWWSDCSVLKSPYDGPLRLVMEPVVSTTQVPVDHAMCNFPLDYAGTWFHNSEYDIDVTINMTHIYFKTLIDQFTYREAYFMCMMNTGTRYLTVAVTVGKCEVDFVCFDMLPREHSVIRWRMAKPYRLSPMEMARPNYLEYIFEQSCWWSAFTIDREDFSWTYKTFILNPPVPVECPIRGRYYFEQFGPASEIITTRFRGITERPRHQIWCKEMVAEWKSCDEYPSRIELDSEYCETVDHTGRPIGEYDIPDWQLTCVGYWREDWKFYMMTWDPEDPTSPFRCWNFERTDWRHVLVSRSVSATCRPMQDARSYQPAEGASLHMVLTEAERRFDDCAQRYLDGTLYSENEDTIMHKRIKETRGRSGATNNTPSNVLFILTALGIICHFL